MRMADCHPDRPHNSKGLCSSCYNKLRRATGRWDYKKYYQDHKDEYKEYSWLKQYGMTREEYDKLLEEQGGHCYFCDYRPPKGHHLMVDHDHNTGVIRGLLCFSHNQSLGKFGDDVEGVMRLLDYVKRGQK